MKVLVTGGCGFLGFHVCRYFREQGAEVIAYDNLAKHEFARNPYMLEAARDYNRVELAQAGGGDRGGGYPRQGDAGGPHARLRLSVPHCGAAGDDDLLGRSGARFLTNTRGTFNVLESARLPEFRWRSVRASIHSGRIAINASLARRGDALRARPGGDRRGRALLQGSVTPLHASKRAQRNLRAGVHRHVQAAGRGVPADRHLRAESVRRRRPRLGRELRDPRDRWGCQSRSSVPASSCGTSCIASDAAAAFGAFYRSPLPGCITSAADPGTCISLVESITAIERLTARKAEVQFQEGRFGDLHYFVTGYARFQRATGWQPRCARPKESPAWLRGSSAAPNCSVAAARV